MEDIKYQIEKLSTVPESMFNINDAVEKVLLFSMCDELVRAFGGETYDGDYIEEGDMSGAAPEDKLSYLLELHKKYEQRVKEVRGI